MRVISGKFRGKRLHGPRGRELRPTSDRLKETLFNILGPGIQGAAVLDAFAGTGAIGLEALSRGAQAVVFIESDREAVRLIRKNLQWCGVTSGYQILQEDVFTSLRSLARSGFQADIAFLDPPYRWGPYRDLLATLFQTGIASAETRVVLEHHRKTALPDSDPEFSCIRIVSQSDKCLSFYSKAPSIG
jgi:16S rRNA (guanine(966)-N(2))-methyltransferase RsmD